MSNKGEVVMLETNEWQISKSDSKYSSASVSTVGNNFNSNSQINRKM